MYSTLLRRRMRSGWLLLVSLLLWSCCARNGVENPYCRISQPILISQKDEMSDETARQILTHNETWEAICSPIHSAPKTP